MPVFWRVSGISTEIDIRRRDTMMKRTVEEKLREAKRQMDASGLSRLRQERNTLLDQQQKSLEPDGYTDFIEKIETRLEAPQPTILRDLWVFVLKEKDGWDWQRIGDYLYGTVRTESGRKSRARRAWDRADKWLDIDHADSELVEIFNRAGLL